MHYVDNLIHKNNSFCKLLQNVGLNENTCLTEQVLKFMSGSHLFTLIIFVVSMSDLDLKPK